MKLLVVIGSLRAAAFSRKLGEAVAGLVPEGVEAELIDGRDLPLYDQDLEADEKPAAVQTLIDQITACDGLVFVCPEFNYGIPGTLKNLIDWASRPPYNSPLKGTPSLVISLSVAPMGGARAHLQLCGVLSGTLTPVFVGPGFTIPSIHEKFDADGAMTDEQTQGRLQHTLGQFVEWAREQ